MPLKPPSRHPNQDPLAAEQKIGTLVSVSTFAACLFVLLLVSVFLLIKKESPSFWVVPIGAEPSFFQDFVYITFYPILVINAFLTLGFTVVICRLFKRVSFVSFMWLIATAGVFWFTIFTIVVTVVTNNIVNLAQGNPLHYH